MSMSFSALNHNVEQRAKQDAEYRRRLAKKGKPLLSDARRLTESELLAKLQQVGIELDKGSYAKIAEHALSAEEICHAVVNAEVRSRFKCPFAEDWVWFALTILWERWFPQWPNFERLDDRIQAGYAISDNDPSGACEQWLGAWEDFLLLYDKGSFTSMAEFDEAFRGSQDVSNWTSDFELELGNAAVKAPRWHQQRAQFCDEFLRRFGCEDSLTLENMRRALGEAKFGMGDCAGGDALFKQWLTDDPQWGWGWIGWSDCHFISATPENRDLQRAEALLNQGLQVPGVRDREELLERLAEVCREQGRSEDASRLQRESDSARRAKTGSVQAEGSAERPAEGPVENLERPQLPARSEKIGRNEPCPCGSGKKYKKCCLAKDEERARQASVSEMTESLPANTNAGESVDSPSWRETDRRLPTEMESRLDRLWNDFEALKQPTLVQMDEFLDQLLSLPPELIPWSDLLHSFARHKHSDLPGVFHRICAAVPHTKDSGMAFFYWAAAEEFTRQGAPHLLPEVASGFRNLDKDSYDADALMHVEDTLLAAGFEAETLRLAEHFLPIEREDDGLTPWALPQRCELIFELRIGQALRSGPSTHASAETLAKQLRSNLEDEIHEDSARLAAEVAADVASDAPWERTQFDLVSGDILKGEKAWTDCLRLFGTLIRLARETWLLEGRPPGCILRGLTLLLNSVYAWKERRGKKSKSSSNNLLDCLGPGGLENRLVQSCRDLIGLNVPRAKLLLQAHEVLTHSAARHHLINPALCEPVQKELARLRCVLDR